MLLRFTLAKEEARKGFNPGSRPYGKHAAKNIGVKINAAKGKYKGMYQKRVYLLDVHTKLPAAVFSIFPLLIQ